MNPLEIDGIWTDPCVLSLTLPQRTRWYELCRLACRQRRPGVIPRIPGAGLARALGTYPHLLERSLCLLAELGLVERPEDGTVHVPLICEARPQAAPPAMPDAMPEPPVDIPLDLDGLSRTEKFRRFGTTSDRKILAAAGVNGTNGTNGHHAPERPMAAPDAPQNVPAQNVPAQNVPDPRLLERFQDEQSVPEDVPAEHSPSRASENVPNVPTLSGERENINILNPDNVNVPTLGGAGGNDPDVPAKNVPPPNNSAPPPNVSSQPPTTPPAMPRLAGQALAECNAAVNQVQAYTQDSHSRGWFEKLWKLCHYHKNPGLWSRALRITTQAVARPESAPAKDKLGAYFGKALEGLLILEGVPVDAVVKPERLAEAKRAAEELRKRLQAEDDQS